MQLSHNESDIIGFDVEIENNPFDILGKKVNIPSFKPYLILRGKHKIGITQDLKIVNMKTARLMYSYDVPCIFRPNDLRINKGKFILYGDLTETNKQLYIAIKIDTSYFNFF